MTDQRGRPAPELDVVVVGAGFGGIFMVHRLASAGFSVKGFEAAEDLGGVWFWNNYPGARCDGESLAYSYSFSHEIQQNWSWSQRYGAQPEILAYLNHVADTFGVRERYTFNTRVTRATWDDDAQLWTIETDGGKCLTARHVVSAVGCLSAARVPDFPGLNEFAGEWFHTGHWPDHAVALAGKRVAVVGTGSSGIQIVTQIAREVAHLTVLQRTPNFSLPARNRPMDPEYEARVKKSYRVYRDESRGLVRPTASDEPFVPEFSMPPRGSGHDLTPEEREQEMQRRWDHGYGGAPLLFAFSNMMTDPVVNEYAADFVRRKIREIVKAPDVADLLSPRGYPLGSKRLCVDTGYYETFNRDNVELIDVKSDPIMRIARDGIVLKSGRLVAVDTLIFATGYDAMTGALARIDIRGRGGLSLAEKWVDGPRAYLGLSVAGFPNFFIMTGPGSPSVISNVVDSLEQHGELIADMIEDMRDRQLGAIEADSAAEDEWVAHVDAVAESTLWPLANSWYRGCNIPGKPQVFMVYVGGPARYRQKCDEMKAANWAGYRFTPLPVAATAKVHQERR